MRLNFLRHQNFPVVYLKNTWAQAGRDPSTFRLWTDTLPLRHCILVQIKLWHSLSLLLEFSGRFCSYWQPNFPAVSGSYLPGFSGSTCSYWQPDFPAVSVDTCLNFLALPFLARECKKSPSRDQKAGIFQPYLLFLVWIFRRSFSGMGNFKKLYGRQTNCSGIDSGIFCP